MRVLNDQWFSLTRFSLIFICTKHSAVWLSYRHGLFAMIVNFLNFPRQHGSTRVASCNAQRFGWTISNNVEEILRNSLIRPRYLEQIYAGPIYIQKDTLSPIFLPVKHRRWFPAYFRRRYHAMLEQSCQLTRHWTAPLSWRSHNPRIEVFIFGFHH